MLDYRIGQPHWNCSEGKFTSQNCTPVPAEVAAGAQTVSPEAVDTAERDEPLRPKPPRSWDRSRWEWEILNCPDVNRANKAVGLVASRRANFEDGRDCYPSQQWIAGVLDYASTDPVRKALRALEEDGWLYRDGFGPVGTSGFRPHKYRLTIPKCGHAHNEDALPRIKK